MNIEKAIETLRMENDLMQFDPTTGEENPIELQNKMNQECYSAHLMAISALEKQIPVNLILRNSGVCECPNCKTIYSYIEYCSGCGQKLNVSSVR